MPALRDALLRKRRSCAVALLVALALIAAACGATPSAAERVLVSADPTTTAEALPFPAPTASSSLPFPAPSADDDVTPVATTAPLDVEPTATPVPPPTAVEVPTATPTAEDETPDDDAEPTPAPTEEPEPTATPRPATPTPDRDREPTSTPQPTSTATPTPEPTATTGPTATPTPAGPAGVSIECVAEPASLAVKVDETIAFRAVQEPISAGVTYSFNHGDGSINLGPSTFWRYSAPGTYAVSLRWVLDGDEGIVSCGSVEVTGVGAGSFQPGDYVGLGEGEAGALAESRVLVVRVVRRDGEDLPGTTDFRSDRINFEITNGVVTAASLG